MRLCLLLLFGWIATGAAPMTIVPLPELPGQQFVGFGHGSMHQSEPKWFATYSKEVLSTFADDVFTLKNQGLGLTINRFYMPAGENPAHRHMGRRAAGSRCPAGFEQTPGKLNWEGHEPYLWMARLAQERGATMLAFWNTPPWHMTVSGCAAGGADAKANNLRPDAEHAFAIHMAEVLRHCRDAWGLRFRYVCPINEPESNYWHEGGGQEGCHTDARQAIRLTALLDEELSKRQLTCRIQLFEAAYSKSLGYLDTLLGNDRVASRVPVISCHQYVPNDKAMRQWGMRAQQNRKELWMSEWGDWKQLANDPETQEAHAFGYVGKILQAINVMHAQAWCMWQAQYLFAAKKDRLVRRKTYWAVAHFSRFIRPGMTRIELLAAPLQGTAWLDQKGHRLVLVLANPGDQAQTARPDLSRFTGTRLLTATRTDRQASFAEVTAELRASGFLSLGPRSIATLEYAYKGSAPALVRNPGFEELPDTAWQHEGAEAGVQENYPTGGFRNGFVHSPVDQGSALVQTVQGLVPGQRYRLEANCAESGTKSQLAIRIADQETAAPVQGGGYARYTVDFTAPANGQATIRFACSARLDAAKHSWGTIDNVVLRRH